MISPDRLSASGFFMDKKGSDMKDVLKQCKGRHVAWLIYSFMKRKHNDGSEFHFLTEDFANLIGYDQRTVQRDLKFLIDKGILTHRYVGGKQFRMIKLQ